MADITEISEDLKYDELTLVQKRNRNIERNKNFFLSLFGSSSLKELTTVDSHTSEKNSDISRDDVGRNRLDSLICEEERKREDIVTSLSVYYPHRRDVIQNLAGYLNPDFVPAPALLVHGPTGCGKTEICISLLEKMYPHSNARISCDSYSTSRQLLRAIWIEVIYTKFKFDNISTLNKTSRSFLAYQNSFGCRTPSNFGDLATLLGPFLDSFLGCKNSFYSTHNISGADAAASYDAFDKEESNTVVNCKSKKGGSRSENIHGFNPYDGSRREGVLYLFLDRIDAVERLERGLTNGLLRLSELSHPRIKIIATVVDVPLKVLACTPLGFSPYTEKQLKEILVSRAKYAGFCKYNHVSSTEALARTETGRESGTGTGRGREVVCVDTKAARTTDFSNDIDVFAAVLLVVLPQFLMKSRHVRDLWETLMSLWGYIFYTSNPALYVSDTSAVDPAVPSSSSSFSSSSSSESVSADIALKVNSSNSSSSSKATGRFQIDFKAVKAAAQDILLMPTTHVLKVQLPSRRRGTRGRILDPEQNLRLARLEKRISRSSADDGKGGSSEFRAELLQALPDDVNSVMDSNQCKQRGKRKRVQAGHDAEAEENASSMRAGASSRAFTMDRLASIFAQIASTGGVEKLGGGAKAAIALGHKAALTDLGEFTVEQIASSYGDSDLFASIKCMEQRNLLVRAPAWSLDRPLYISTINLASAEQVSSSLSFNLHDYISQ